MKLKCKCGCETTINPTMELNGAINVECINCKEKMSLVLLEKKLMEILVKGIQTEEENKELKIKEKLIKELCDEVELGEEGYEAVKFVLIKHNFSIEKLKEIVKANKK